MDRVIETIRHVSEIVLAVCWAALLGLGLYFAGYRRGWRRRGEAEFENFLPEREGDDDEA